MHVNHRAGFPLFAGESLLHIACVNQQEELLCLMLQLAEQRLPSADFVELLRSQARARAGTLSACACLLLLAEATPSNCRRDRVPEQQTRRLELPKPASPKPLIKPH